MSAPPSDRVPIEALLVHREWVRALARSLVSDPNCADDVEQETWRMAIERPPRHGGALRAWLRTVVRNVARATGRSESRRERRDSAQPQRPGVTSPSDVVAEAELHQLLAAAVLALDEPYRSTVLHRWFEGKEPAQIAAEEGVPVATVRTRMKRGVAMLRARMDVEVGDDREAWCLLLVGTRRMPSPGVGITAGTVATLAGEAAMGMSVRWILAASVLLGAGVAGAVLVKPNRLPESRDASTAEGAVAATAATRDARATRATSAVAAAADTTSAIASAANGTLRGTVVRPDGTPVAGARVEVVVFPWRRVAQLNWRGLTEAVVETVTTTAADGAFALAPRDAEPRCIRVSASDCAARIAGPFAAGDAIRIVVGPGFTLRAEVRDTAGEPVAGARLLLLDRDDGQGDGAMRDAMTDASGVCTFSGLAGGSQVTLAPAADGAFTKRRLNLPTSGEVTLRIVSPAGRKVRGRVVDAVTRSPVAGASVGHKLALLCGSTTDADGRFALTSWDAGRIRDVHVLAKGYGRTCVSVQADAPNEIALVRGFSATGRIVDDAGAPVPRALVAVEATDRASQPWRYSFGFAVSGEDGSFRIDELTRDLPHVLAATASRGTLVRRAVAAQGNDGPDVVALGDLVLVAPRAIAGHVHQPDGSPAPRVQVRLRGPLEADGVELARDAGQACDATGRFRFADLVPGSYVLTADAPAALGVEMALVVPPDRDLDDVRVPPSSAEGPILVRVRDEAGKPLAGVVVWAQRRFASVTATTDAEGNVRFAWNSADPIQSVRAGMVELAPDPVEIVAGGRSYDVVVERGARVTCRLLDPDGRPIEGAALRVDPARTSMIPFTDTDGRVTFAIPARGDVTIRFDGDVTGQQPALLEARAEHVTPQRGEVVLRCRRVETGKSLAIRVLAADGTPVGGMKVRLFTNTTYLPDAATGDDGVVRFSDLPARDFNVLVLSGVGRFGPRGLHVVPDGQEFIAQFPAVRTLGGDVVWESGGDAEGASVMVDRGGKPFTLGVADARGRFTVEVPAADSGPFRLRVSAMRGKTWCETTLEAVTPGDTIRVVLRPQ